VTQSGRGVQRKKTKETHVSSLKLIGRFKGTRTFPRGKKRGLKGEDVLAGTRRERPKGPPKTSYCNTKRTKEKENAATELRGRWNRHYTAGEEKSKDGGLQLGCGRKAYKTKTTYDEKVYWKKRVCNKKRRPIVESSREAFSESHPESNSEGRSAEKAWISK